MNNNEQKFIEISLCAYAAGFAIQFEENSSETSENEGLLLYGGGTVCDDHFTDDAAHAICRELGFGKAISWRSGNFWGVIQDRKPIHLDDVQCSGDRLWSSCSFSTTHNCGHGEDVFLTCQGKWNVLSVCNLTRLFS